MILCSVQSHLRSKSAERNCAVVVGYDADMKWEQLERGSLRLSDTTRFRLARPSDDDFINEMGDLSGGYRTQLPVTDAQYAAGLNACLSRRGGYWKKIQEVYNNSVNSESERHPIVAATAASAFDLIAIQGKKRVGALSVGASHSLIDSVIHNIHDHQLLSLVGGLPKLISLAVIPEVRGEGIGGDLMVILGRLLSRMGSPGIYGQCDDSSSLVRFYEEHHFTVLPSGIPLNVWPVAGRHVVLSSALIRTTSDESQGPFIAPEPGQRMMFRLTEAETGTAARMVSLNEVAAASEGAEVEATRLRPGWFARMRNRFEQWFR